MSIQHFAQKITSLLASRWFFYGTIALFVLQALWFVFSAQYPMAFDENFHFGLVQVYGQQWSPFITEAPEGTGPLGALTREPSYLFSYLMSFPYRIAAFLTANQDIQLILLRLLNVALFTAGIFAFRKLLLRIGASHALTHFSLVAFTLIPIVPFLAAHLNYDNLLFLLVPYVLMAALAFADGLRKNTFLVQPFLLFVTLCFIASIVKYPFLPIAASIAVYLIGVAFWRKRKSDLLAIVHSIRGNFARLSMSAKILLISSTLLGGALFAERYGVNYIQYGSLIPDCADVIDFDHCSQYGPWMRNYNIGLSAPEYVEPNLPFYAANWYYDMTYRLFFAINSEYYTERPLYLPFITAHFIAISGVFLCFIFGRRLVKKYKGLLLFGVITAIYAGTLFSRGYSTYLSTTEFLALNGRYFIPIMLLIFIFIGLAYKELFDLIQRRAVAWKVGFTAVTLFFLLQGGGVLTYILRSDASWHRQDSTVIYMNDTAKQLLEPFILKREVKVPLSN